MKCINCKEAISKQGKANLSFEFEHARVQVTMPALLCNCGEVVYEGADVQRAELLAAEALADAGAISGEILRFQRKAMGFSAKALAKLLGVSAEHVSRMETGKKEVTLSTAVLVGSLVKDCVDGKSRTRRLVESAAARSAPRELFLELPSRRTRRTSAELA